MLDVIHSDGVFLTACADVRPGLVPAIADRLADLVEQSHRIGLPIVRRDPKRLERRAGQRDFNVVTFPLFQVLPQNQRHGLRVLETHADSDLRLGHRWRWLWRRNRYRQFAEQ